MNQLKDRVIIVTGAGRGLGREHALLLAAEGAKVVVDDTGADRTGTETTSVLRHRSSTKSSRPEESQLPVSRTSRRSTARANSWTWPSRHSARSTAWSTMPASCVIECF